MVQQITNRFYLPGRFNHLRTQRHVSIRLVHRNLTLHRPKIVIRTASRFYRSTRRVFSIPRRFTRHSHQQLRTGRRANLTVRLTRSTRRHMARLRLSTRTLMRHNLTRVHRRAPDNFIDGFLDNYETGRRRHHFTKLNFSTIPRVLQVRQ